MQTYRDYTPTQFDPRGLNGESAGIADFAVLLSQTRDSESIETSNFRTALKRLGGESESVQIHRFGHWAYGWFELLLVDPKSDHYATAKEIELDLESYPILDEMDQELLAIEMGENEE